MSLLQKTLELAFSQERDVPGLELPSRHEWEVPTCCLAQSFGAWGLRKWVQRVRLVCPIQPGQTVIALDQESPSVCYLAQPGRKCVKGCLPRFVKWQTVLLARRACHGHFLGGGGLPRWDFSSTLQGQVLLPLARKQRSKLRRGQSLQEHSLLSHRRDPQRPRCQTCQREMWLPPGGSISECAYFYRLDHSASKPGADRQPCNSMVSIFFNVFYW